MAVSHRFCFALFCVSLAIASNASQVMPQSVGVTPGRDLPRWLDSWSPLSVEGDLPRRLPSASVAMPLLLLPFPKIGLFWSGGNPGAMRWEVDDQRNDISAVRAGQDGDYRRPLDPAAATVTRASGMGWQPLGARGAVIGRALFDRTIRDPSSASDMNESYSSSPFVVTDTSASALRTSRSRLEGAGGWRLGDWGLGVALGYDARTTATVASPFLRRNRAVSPAATVGMVRSFRQGSFKAGVRGSWRGGEETINLIEVAQEGIVFQLEGYREVPRQDIVGGYFRRVSRDTRSAGLSLGGTIGAASWVAYGDGMRLRDELTGQQQDDPVTELWATSGVNAGAALQWPFARRNASFTVQGRIATLDGHAEQVFPARRGLSTSERVVYGSAQFRLLPVSRRWTAVIDASILGEHRERNDSVAGASTTIDGITPGIAVEVGGSVTRALMVSGGYAIARYGGSGTIPAANSRGPLYRRVFAPELDMATAVSRSQAVSVAAQWQAGPATAVWLAGRLERLEPGSVDQSFAPGGDRMARSVVFGVTLAPSNSGER